MRICYVITSLRIGGAEVALARNLPKIQEKGHDVLVAFFHDGPIRQRLAEHNIQTVQIRGLKSPYDPIGWWQLYQFLRKAKPDIIHTSLWSANIMGRLLGKLLKIPVINDLHGNCQKEGFTRNLGDKLTTRYAAATIAVSNSVAQAYRALVLPTHHNKIITIQNGIDIDAIASTQPIDRSNLGIPAKAFVIGSVGRLEPIKGYELLIQAVAQLPANTWLVLVGGGSQQEVLNALAQNLGLSNRCIITGFCNNALSYYSMFNCFALSSHSEGLSLALLEAMAHGLPVVSTNQTMVHDVITNEQTGLLVTSRSAHDLASALAKVQQSAALCAAMGNAGKKHVQLKHNLVTAIIRLNKLYLDTKIQIENNNKI